MFQVLIQGLENMNRAVLDDIVAIEILPKSQWSCPSSLALEDEGEKGDDSVKKEVSHMSSLQRKTVGSHVEVISDKEVSQKRPRREGS